MSEAQTSTISQRDPRTDSAIDLPGQASEPQSAGVLLKQAREFSGLHIAALAVLLKVPVKKLEALESDRLDLLPDAVFVRALAASVCRTLKIDSTIILSRLPQTNAPKLTYQGTGINEPFRSPGDGPGPSLWAQVSRPAVLAGLLLMVGVLVLIFLPAIKTGISKVMPEVSETKAEDVQIEKATRSNVPTEATFAAPTDSSVNVVSSNPTSSLTATTAGADVLFASKSEVSATVSSPSLMSVSKVVSAGTSSPTLVMAANSLDATDVVVFTAKTESWVEATDARGQVVLRRVLAAGEVVGASGVLPLKVIVGRANATQVEIRGKVFDVNAVAKDNVARFEVK